MDTLKCLSDVKLNAFSQQGREGIWTSDLEMISFTPEQPQHCRQGNAVMGSTWGSIWGSVRSLKKPQSYLLSRCQHFQDSVWNWDLITLYLFGRASCVLLVLYNHTWWGWAKGTVNSGIIFHSLFYSPTGILVSDTEIIDKYKITMYFLSKKEQSQQKRHWMWTPSSHCVL